MMCLQALWRSSVCTLFYGELAISSKKRLIKYLGWWVNKSRQSNRWLNVLVIVGLCICLFWLSSFDEEPQSRYDKSPYSRYPIELICEISRVVDGDTIVAKCPKSLKSSERSLRYIRVWDGCT